MISHKCNVCGVLLVVGDNTTQNMIDNHNYRCRACKREYQNNYRSTRREELRIRDQEYRHRIGFNLPMEKNRKCSAFLGVHIAEQVLSKVFKNVEHMQYGNHGYDFICGNGFKIDVKSSCRHVYKGHSDRWGFVINKNVIANYFICLAFDNREDINPEHIWLIDGKYINDHISVSISESNIHKWDDYRLDINKVISCCNNMKL